MGGDSSPLNSPVLVPFPVTGGQVLQFGATGLVDIDGSPNPQTSPDGGPFTTTTARVFGISRIDGPRGALIGVFLGPGAPNPNATPPDVNFSGSARDLPTLYPLLQQPFYIGRGTTRTGANRSIVVPAGATRLFLGVLDYSGSNSNNTGSFAVIFPRNDDLNGDGYKDILWQNRATGEIGAWFMYGTVLSSLSLFSPPQVPDTNWKIVGNGDFCNSDSKPDLVWQNQVTGQIGVWCMNGIGLSRVNFFSPGQVADSNWKIVSTSDFNHDSRPDLVWQNQATGQIGVWFMNGTNLISPSLFNPGQVAPDWKIVRINDLDSDGDPDLVWQNQATGHLVVWFLSGARLTSWSYFTPAQVPDTNWKIPNIWALIQ